MTIKMPVPEVCSCGAVLTQGSIVRWNGEGWEHRGDDVHPQAGYHPVMGTQGRMQDYKEGKERGFEVALKAVEDLANLTSDPDFGLGIDAVYAAISKLKDGDEA